MKKHNLHIICQRAVDFTRKWGVILVKCRSSVVFWTPCVCFIRCIICLKASHAHFNIPLSGETYTIHDLLFLVVLHFSNKLSLWGVKEMKTWVVCHGKGSSFTRFFSHGATRVKSVGFFLCFCFRVTATCVTAVTTGTRAILTVMGQERQHLVELRTCSHPLMDS